MFILEAQKVMGDSWEIYSSGGGCYHAQKEFTSLQGDIIAVEVHWSGQATYYCDEDGKPVNAYYLEHDDRWCDCYDLVWTVENFNDENKLVTDYDNIKFHEDMGFFSSDFQLEISEAMKKFAKCYDEYMYEY